MKERWIRHTAALAIDHRDALTIVGPDGNGNRFCDASADLIRVALDFWSAPHTEEDLVAHLRQLAGECDPGLVSETVRVLRDAGVIRAFAAPSPTRSAAASAGARILVGISGAIAAVDAPALVRLLLARRFDVQVAMTASASRFVSAESLEAITHRPVYRSFRQKHKDGPAAHIHLATWADLIVIYPATAATIARVAHALCTDVLSATTTATTRPILVFPSMNEAMYGSGAVRRNIELLREDGHYVVFPSMGVEVATSPSLRRPTFCGAPLPNMALAAIDLLLRDLVEKRSAVLPASPEEWNRQYETSAVNDLPWFTEDLDADLAGELLALDKGRCLDVGTGPGTGAVFAARHGFDVVATDVSATALAQARRRADGLPIAWVLDDFLETRLWGRFDVLLDRGCFHCLPKTAWPRYAQSAGQLVSPGGRMLLKLHSLEEVGRHGTNAATVEELAEVFGRDFSIVDTRSSSFDGTIQPPPRATLAILRRNEDCA